MAKNFAKANAKKFEEIAKISEEKANIINVKMIDNDNLNDYPKNDEDILYTADLENSINEIGFTDPIEVTSYGQSDGQYMIVSGHRRRAGGVKCGIKVFPCIIKTFNSDEAIKNYVLLANSQRDSSKDPLLFCKRYKMHEEYLNSINFKGSYREEVAKRLGISVSQAARYKQMTKIIVPVWDMVRDGVVSMTSILPVSELEPKEQEQIYNVLQRYISEGMKITQDKIKLIISQYKHENTESESPNDNKPSYHDRHVESKTKSKTEKPVIMIEEKELKAGNSILDYIDSLYDLLNGKYTFKDDYDIEDIIDKMKDTVEIMIEEMNNISKEYTAEKLFNTAIKDIEMKVGEYR